MLMKIAHLSVSYGTIRALHDVSLEVEEGKILSIIGANGAGKSTLLKTVTGLLQAESGDIWYQGRRINKERPDRLVQMGICMVPEGRRIFPDLTVRENLDLGAYTVNSRNLRQELFDLALHTFPRLEERIGQHAGTLSGGEQQMLAMARGLMLNPHILMLDEPSMGLSPILVDLVFDTIKQMNAKGTTILLVEQNALMALSIAHRGYVLQTGQIVLSDTAANLRKNEMVKKAYLGIE